MSTARPSEVRRLKNDRLTGGKVSCGIVFDRELTAEEQRTFYLLPADGDPNPLEFSFEGRVVRYICPEDDEPKWRLTLEIYFVKTFRQTSETPKPSTRDTRSKYGLRKLHIG